MNKDIKTMIAEYQRIATMVRDTSRNMRRKLTRKQKEAHADMLAILQALVEEGVDIGAILWGKQGKTKQTKEQDNG